MIAFLNGVIGLFQLVLRVLITTSFAEISLRDRISQVLRRRRVSALASAAVLLALVLTSCAILPGLSTASGNVITDPAATRPATTTPGPATQKSTGLLSGNALMEILFRGLFTASTSAVEQLYQAIPLQQRGGLSVGELAAFIEKFRGQFPTGEWAASRERVFTVTGLNRQDILQGDAADAFIRDSAKDRWNNNLLLADKSDLLFFGITPLTKDGNPHSPFIFFALQDNAVPILPAAYIRGVLNLQTRVDELTAVFRSGDAEALVPYIQLGLITDSAIVKLKARNTADLYAKYIQSHGKHRLIISEDNQPGFDLLPGMAELRWQGPLDAMDMIRPVPQHLAAHIDPYGQLKIRQVNWENAPEFLPAMTIHNGRGQILSLGETYSQQVLAAFFGAQYPYQRPEAPGINVIGTPTQRHRYGRNVVQLIGRQSTLQKDFSGILIGYELAESEFRLDNLVSPGTSLQKILASWPALEDLFQYSLSQTDAAGMDLIRWSSTINNWREITLGIKNGQLQVAQTATIMD